MPTVLRSGGFRFIIRMPPREHQPPHVHVLTAGAEAVIELDPVFVRSAFRMSTGDVVRAVRLVEAHRDALMIAWRRYHG